MNVTYRKKYLALILIWSLGLLFLAAPLHAFDDCERIIQTVLSTGTQDQVKNMANASERFVKLKALGMQEADFVTLGTDMIAPVDLNLNGNATVTIHDLMALVLNSTMDDRQMSVVLTSLNKIRKYPGVLIRAGSNDGSRRLVLLIESTNNLGFPFEAVAGVFMIEQRGETAIGFSGKVTRAGVGLFEGDFFSTSTLAPGKLKAVDFKGVGGGNWSVQEVQSVTDALINGGQVQLGSATYNVGEFAFGVQAGGSVPTEVQAAINTANQLLTAAGRPPITVIPNIPF